MIVEEKVSDLPNIVPVAKETHIMTDKRKAALAKARDVRKQKKVQRASDKLLQERELETLRSTNSELASKQTNLQKEVESLRIFKNKMIAKETQLVAQANLKSNTVDEEVKPPTVSDGREFAPQRSLSGFEKIRSGFIVF